eukprot:TRINITY_DN3766_c0_g1_i1.p1 TRINITY_DN3766_c0_g1~~TRINITY_DN3766_c0_g1_i1.p1  ORF type:complete len:262 (-),score=26.66 TRINITY_DN3766_c0_g1_i1:235-1020(-)
MASQLLISPLLPRQRKHGRMRNMVKKNRRPTDLSLLCQKTKLCAFNSQGGCERGSMCTYAHSEEELRVPPNLSRTKLCPALLNGKECSDRVHCLFAHTLEETKQLDGKPATFQLSPDVLPSFVPIGFLQILPVITACSVSPAEKYTRSFDVMLTDDLTREAKYLAWEGKKHDETHSEADLWSQRSTIDSECERAYDVRKTSSECSVDEASCPSQSLSFLSFRGIEVRVKNTFFHFASVDTSRTSNSHRRSSSLPPRPCYSI